MRLYKPFVVALAIAGFITLAVRLAPAEPSAPATEILWDVWGVPHVFAASDRELFYALGWAQAHNHGDLVLELLGRARGRAAEYWGEAGLESDRWLRTMGVPARAERWYQEQTPEQRAFLDAFAAGINDYAKAHPEAIADRVEVVLPVSARDVLAHVQQAVHFTFVIDRGAIDRSGWRPETLGSNAWAVAPSRSASGHAMLVANPHLPWSDLFIWYEAQIVSPNVNAYGAGLVGTPFLGIAFNDHLGWTHTVNTFDGADLYELELAGNGYRFDGETRPFERGEETIKIKNADGTLREEKLAVSRSVHGPVVAQDNGKALALRVAGLDAAHLPEQYWQMARAKNLGEFETALSRLEMPMFTTMYADDAGHILHLFGGRTPVRPPGDWNWSGIVPGNTTKTLWTTTHPYAELPRVQDPPSGWLQNANDPPWTTTFPLALDPDRFPRYLAPRGMSMRAQRSAKFLAEDSSITFDELQSYKLSTRMEVADRIFDDLARVVAASENAGAKAALQLLERWDHTADSQSRGAALFERFWRRYAQGNPKPYQKPWDPSEPLTTPDGLSDPQKAVLALAEAKKELETQFGRADVSWGESHRLRVGTKDLPGNGGPGSLGIFRVVDYGGGGRAGTGTTSNTATGGDSFVFVLELAKPVRAKALLTYGNASQPGSPHKGDQLELFAKKELRPVWRTREEIEKHLEKRERVPKQRGGPSWSSALPRRDDGVDCRPERNEGPGRGGDYIDSRSAAITPRIRFKSVGTSSMIALQRMSRSSAK